MNPGQDQKGIHSLLGANFNGILIFQGNRKTNHFKWNEVQKINYEGKMFIIHLIYIEVSADTMLQILRCVAANFADRLLQA